MKLSVVPGLAVWHWGFNELSAAFFIMGVIVGLLAGMRLSGTAQAYVRGFRGMAYAGLLIGFARAIYVVLQDGRIIDTIVHAMFTPLEGLTVLAYQYGAGLCELLTPTNGALMAILASAGVRYEAWLRHVLPLYLGLVALGLVAIAVAVAVGL